jgi:hypothetical protein
MLRNLSGLMALAVLVLVPLAVHAGNPNPGVLPPQSSAFGQTYGEWAGDWWNWALQFPAATCPLLDTTGEFGHLGQTGNVWFLAGNFGGVSHRAISVPTGKALFFPLINVVRATPEAIIRGGGDPTGMTHEEKEAFLRNLANATTDLTSSLVAHVDGVALQDLFDYRAESPPGGFLLHIPAGSVAIPSYAAGDHDPAVADGYWLMLAPLSKGKHQIHFSSARPGFSLDVTYDLSVGGGRSAEAVPEPSSVAMLGLGAVGLVAYGWRWRRKRS